MRYRPAGLGEAGDFTVIAGVPLTGFIERGWVIQDPAAVPGR